MSGIGEANFCIIWLISESELIGAIEVFTYWKESTEKHIKVYNECKSPSPSPSFSSSHVLSVFCCMNIIVF